LYKACSKYRHLCILEVFSKAQALSESPFQLCFVFIQFGLIELDNRDDGAAIQDALLAITGGRTVPRVFIGGKFVGGGSEVKALQESNQLVPLLQAAGVKL